MGRLQPAHGQRALGARGVLGAVGLLLAVPLATGCSNGDTGAKAQSKPGIEGDLQTVANTAGCAKPQLQNKQGAGFRQGVCAVDGLRYTVMSFDSKQDEQAWLKEAKQWGGTYLVGPNWIVVATPEILKTLQGKLGGDISSGSTHDAPNGDTVGTQ